MSFLAMALGVQSYYKNNKKETRTERVLALETEGSGLSSNYTTRRS